ncbi:MAG: FHA domain-containing protein [Myxococcota bacterium]|nr:FHA domain-containing protein [Myxococcota bacterium]
MSKGIGRSEIEACDPKQVGRVVVKHGFYAGLETPLEDSGLVIGRGREADLVIAESTISRAHARIDPGAGDGWLLQDLGSTNGTHVNGSQVSTQRLADGDEIRMGRLVLGIQLD